MHKMNRQDVIYWSAFAALAVAALVMGYHILKPDLSKIFSFRLPQTAIAPDKGDEPAAEEKAAILNTPPQDAPTSTKSEYFGLVQKFAVETATVDLSGCAPTPIVARLKEGSRVTFTNKDGSPHELQINPKHVYTIPAKGSTEVEVDFGFGPGWYGYGCDDSQRATGVFWVTP